MQSILSVSLNVTHVHELPAQEAGYADWPAWVPDSLQDLCADHGIAQPWQHQVVTANHAHTGHNVIIATGTASGKSLAYQLPILSDLLDDQQATALYLAPTKALARDQLTAVSDLGLNDIRPAAYDGETAVAERDWARAHSRWLFTNPDMLHHAILPNHNRWAHFLRRLRYVVVDECHSYRGVFGSHVAQVIRRLRRLTAHYRSQPVFMLASATMAEPGAFGARLLGQSVSVVDWDDSPHGSRFFVLAQPADDAVPKLLAELVREGQRTLVFVRSRHGAEVVAAAARRLLAERTPELVDRVAAYRAGYLAEQRRELESTFRGGELLGVASTNALELGVNITGLDAVILAGFPGTLASFWQQTGRAGRDGREARCIFIARDDPLDNYLVHHPQAIFDRPVEATVCDPTNRYVLAPHLAMAASELPLRESDLPLFGGEPARHLLAEQTRNGSLRRRSNGWYWVSRKRPHVSLRGSGAEPICLVEENTGRLLGTVDAAASDIHAYPGAIYLHQGETFLVNSLDFADAVALVERTDADWSTHVRHDTDLTIVEVAQKIAADDVELCFGSVEVTRQVTGYVRRRIATGEILDTNPLDLPPRMLRTTAVWFAFSPDLVTGGRPAGNLAGSAHAADLAGSTHVADLAGSAHAAEHAAIGLLPVVATCDRWDIGGLSTPDHRDIGSPAIFVYDGYAGGAGFAERGFAAAIPWLTATLAAVRECRCDTGCPSCVHSPKCGNGNEPLCKPGAITLLNALVERLSPPFSRDFTTLRLLSPAGDPHFREKRESGIVPCERPQRMRNVWLPSACC